MAPVPTVHGGALDVNGTNLLKLLRRITTNADAAITASAMNSQLMTEEDAAALLSYLVKLRCCSDQNGGSENAAMEWNEANVELVRLTVKAAIQSLSSSSFTSQTRIMDGKMARRLLTDGVLPFASSAVPMPSTSPFSSFGTSLFHQGQPLLAEKSSAGADVILPCVWIAKLIKSIVVEDLLPIALMPRQPDCSGKKNDGTNNDNCNNNGIGSSSNKNSSCNITTALEILLSTFLTRMDTDESSQLMLPPTPTSSTDAVLDRLCGFAMETNNDSLPNPPSSQTECLRPAAATSVIAALREFETSNETCTLLGGRSGTGLGRLSRRRVWTLKRGKPTSENNTQPHESTQRYHVHYIYVDRPTSLLRTGLSSLQSLAGDVGRDGNCDLDALPPLAYQLSLLPMSMSSTSSSTLVSSGDGQIESGDNGKVVFTQQESDKQRGMRLRRMCLEGIAYVLEDDVCTLRVPCSHTDDTEDCQSEMKTTSRYHEAHRWARYTSLSHLGNSFRSDPMLSKAMLSLLSGEILRGVQVGSVHQKNDRLQSQDQRPFRYARLTPFKLAMGLSMATSVPRMRSLILGAICDLVLEEELLRTRRGLAAVDPFEEDLSSSNKSAVNRTNNRSRRQPWMDCLVRCLEMECIEKNGQNDRGDGDDKGISHVLHCLLSVAKFAENEHGSNSFGVGGGGEGGGCSSSILQSLHQLGFLLIDCVKKDEPCKNESNTLQAMQSIAVLAPNLDITSFASNHVTHGSRITSASAPHAAAAVGRFLLCFLFYQSSSSSLSSSSSCISSSQSGLGETALCRSIIRSSFEKCCGNAPNSLEHAMLMKDLLRFRPLSIRHYLYKDLSNDRENVVVNDLGWSMSGESDEQMIIALALTSNYLPSIIDALSNIPSGGMSPRVASQAIVPSLGCLLLLMAAPSQRGLVGSLWKRHDLEDSVNQTFLFAKKCLYAADVEKRKCAANMLVMLLGVASVAASISSSRNCCVAVGSRGDKSSSIWSSIMQDIKACLRRSLTQHQGEVRMEIYSSLVALLPASAPCGNRANKELSATQDATSPASSTASGTRGNRTPPPNISSFKNIFDSIPPIGQHATISIVSELLLSSLERYITIPKEERIDREARRARAAQGVGLSQMEMIIEEESDRDRDTRPGPDEQSNPFRFEKCISTRLASASESDGMNDTIEKGKKKQSKIPLGQSLFIEAIHRINEPLSYLIASCIAVTSLTSGETNDWRDIDKSGEHDTDSPNNWSSEMHKAINRLRRQFVNCTDIEQYLQWIKTNKTLFDIKENIKRAKEMAINKLATLMLVSAAADALMNSCDFKDEKSLAYDRTDFNDLADEIEDLFLLRTKAIEEAAAIMSSFVVKPARAVLSAKSNNKKKKVLKDVNSSSSSQSGELHAVETKSEKSSDLTKLSSSEISKASLAKNRKFIETMLGNTCPANNQDFLAESLRKFGAEASKKLLDDADSDHDEDHGNKSDGSAHARLSKCLAFRRFIITKSLLLMSGTSSIVRAGSSFSPFSLAGGVTSNKSKIHIAASLLLGPLLFVEFCSHCYDIDQTSIESSKSSSSSDLSLAQLSLRAFTSCVRGMMINTGYHPLSKAARVNAILTSAIRKVSIAIPSSVDGWEFYRKSESMFTAHCLDRVPSDDVALTKTLLPILSLATSSRCVSSSQVGMHICLFSELLSNCMYGEARECCYLIASVAEAFEEANCMEQQGVFLLRAFELGQHAQNVGVLGIDHSDASNENNDCVSAAISVAMKLNCGLDGNSSCPLPLPPDVSQDNLRLARSKMGLSMTKVENWPENHRNRLEKEVISENGMVGIASQIAWAILATHDIDRHFITTFDKNAQTRKELKLDVVKAVTRTSDANSMREKASIALTISSAIDGALENAEFVALKLIPHMLGSIDLAQRFVSELLFSISKMISLSAPSANFLRVDGSFASALLRSTKRLYGILTKLVLTFVKSPQALSSNETKKILDYLVGTLMRRVSALLLGLQEKQETAGGRLIAESKIESHGKIAALLVFEKEKLDNSLLNVSAKLKQRGRKHESEWLEKHIVANLNPDFSIKGIAEARKREAPGAGSKRKATVQSSTKKKCAMLEEESDNENNDDDDSVIESVDADDSMDDDDDVISLSKLTADMDGDQKSDEESEESEAEFD